jgi:D-galactonate transporter
MTKSAGMTNMRWMMVFMAFVGTAINYIDRTNLALAMPYLKTDLGLDKRTIGYVMSAFFWTYACFQLPSGWFVDKVGPRIAYTVAVVWWSAFTAAGSLARGFFSMFGIRLLLGVGEAPAYPTNAKIVSEWFPKKERALATSIFDSGSRGGNIAASFICPAITVALGWRMSFVITGALGIVWATFWWRIYKRPQEHPRASQAERAYIAADQPPPEAIVKVPWGSLFKYRMVWGMMAGFFCLNFVMYFFITWFPTYLVDARGFKDLKMGAVSAIPPAAGMILGWIGGFTSDRLVRRGIRLNWARKGPIVFGMLLSSTIGLAVFVPEAWQAIALLSLCNGGVCFAAASVWSLPADVAPTRGHIASIGGIQNFASNAAGIVSTIAFGALYQATGTFVAPMLLAGCVGALSAVSYLVIVPEIAPLKVSGQAKTEIEAAIA